MFAIIQADPITKLIGAAAGLLAVGVDWWLLWRGADSARDAIEWLLVDLIP